MRAYGFRPGCTTTRDNDGAHDLVKGSERMAAAREVAAEVAAIEPLWAGPCPFCGDSDCDDCASLTQEERDAAERVESWAANHARGLAAGADEALERRMAALVESPPETRPRRPVARRGGKATI